MTSWHDITNWRDPLHWLVGVLLSGALGFLRSRIGTKSESSTLSDEAKSHPRKGVGVRFFEFLGASAENRALKLEKQRDQLLIQLKDREIQTLKEIAGLCGGSDSSFDVRGKIPIDSSDI